MHASNSFARGRLTLCVRTAAGTLVARRRARNMVLQGGATRVAELLSGLAGAKPIDTIGVGFATDPGGATLAALTPPPASAGIAADALRTPLAADAFTVAADQPGAIQLRINAVFKPAVDLAAVTEAGLLAGDTLYNQVIFEPVTLAVGQDVTFFWQIDFPFGH